MSDRHRLAYLVDGRMAAGTSGSGHHIRNFFDGLVQLGVEAACFDSLTGARLDPLVTANYAAHGRRARTRGLARTWLAERAPVALRGALAHRKARARLRMTGDFPAEAFEPLRLFQPDSLLCRMSLANTFAYHASRRIGVRYGLECNAPILEQERVFGTLVDLEECERREAALLSGASYVTYVSEATRDICERVAAYRDVPGYIVRNCADDAFFEVERTGALRKRLRDALGVAVHETLAVYAGSYQRWHSVVSLVEAVRAITDPGIKVLLVGWGRGAREVQKAVRRAGLASRVIMVGNVAHAEVPAYLSAADVGIQPGANRYSAPLKLIEYMAASLAVIAPRVPPVEEVLVHASNAWLVDQPSAMTLADALVRLSRDPDLRSRLGQRAREDVRHMRWRANAGQVLDIIHRHTPPDAPRVLSDESASPRHVRSDS